MKRRVVLIIAIGCLLAEAALLYWRPETVQISSVMQLRYPGPKPIEGLTEEQVHAYVRSWIRDYVREPNATEVIYLYPATIHQVGLLELNAAYRDGAEYTIVVIKGDSDGIAVGGLAPSWFNDDMDYLAAVFENSTGLLTSLTAFNEDQMTDGMRDGIADPSRLE